MARARRERVTNSLVKTNASEDLSGYNFQSMDETSDQRLYKPIGTNRESSSCTLAFSNWIPVVAFGHRYRFCKHLFAVHPASNG